LRFVHDPKDTVRLHLCLQRSTLPFDYRTLPAHDPANPPPSKATRHKSRHLSRLANIPILGRSKFVARMQQAAHQVAPAGRFPTPKEFLDLLQWLGPYIKDFFRRKIAYPLYPEGQSGIFRLDTPQSGPLKIAVAADWATGTLESETVAKNMLAKPAPACTVHLGDVYTMGETGEIEENCLGKNSGQYIGVEWPRGTHGSFALMGNHEMYSGGHAYVETFLPTMGLSGADEKPTACQLGSYFCLVTEGWIVLGLDTAYHSGGVPMLAGVPLISRIPWLNVDSRFNAAMLAWLQRTFASLKQSGDDRKPVVILTHQQPFSRFETAFPKPVRQLQQLGLFEGRELVWLCGHEHRFTVYNRQVVEGLTVYPRCIGHAGMPVSVSKLKKPTPEIAFYDPRTHPIDQQDTKTLVGYNGHAVLLFDGAKLTVQYRDICGNNLLLSETFAPQQDGTLAHAVKAPEHTPLRSGML
jgi:hypothetical protein